MRVQFQPIISQYSGQLTNQRHGNLTIKAKNELRVDEIIAKQDFDFFGEKAMVGTPEDVAEMIDDYRKRGRVTHLVCGMAMSGLDPHHIRNSMQLFANDVMPKFR